MLNINYFNISSIGRTTVNNIAKIIIKELNLNNVQITYSGGKIGWKGDIPKFEYDTTKLINLGLIRITRLHPRSRVAPKGRPVFWSIFDHQNRSFEWRDILFGSHILVFLITFQPPKSFL